MNKQSLMNTRILHQIDVKKATWVIWDNLYDKTYKHYVLISLRDTNNCLKFFSSFYNVVKAKYDE